MSYPGYPPSGGGYPPPQPSTGYPPMPTGAPALGVPAPYPPGPTGPSNQPSPWIPGGPPPGPGGSIGFGMPSVPPVGPTGYPPPQQGGYPGTYPPQSGYPPAPPGGSSYPPAPPGGSSYPPGPPQSTYPPPTGPQSYGTAPPTQQTPGGYSTAPPPVPSAYTHHTTTHHTPSQPTHDVAKATQGVASMSVSTPREPKTEGTVKPYASFDAEADAAVLRKAMKGFGTDEKAIISVLAYRSNAQRIEIKNKFKTMYGKDLIKELKSELSGHFEDTVLGLLMTPSEYDAFVLREAIKGVGTDEHALVEVLCTRTNEQIVDVKERYKKDYGRDLEKDVISDTSGHFKRLLVSMLTGAREADGPVNRQRAREDAQALYQAGEARWGTDESKFNVILASRSFAHLRVVFDEYSKICKYDIEQSISREMSGDLKEGMIAIVKCVRDRTGYFAEALYKSMKGLGTDDRTLVRVMITRCEVDMVQIKDKFYSSYHKTLGSFIKGDTSGDYKRILMALAGEEY